MIIHIQLYENIRVAKWFNETFQPILSELQTSVVICQGLFCVLQTSLLLKYLSEGLIWEHPKM